jgi:coenzyme PQQ precursor peptide PqqA
MNQEGHRHRHQRPSPPRCKDRTPHFQGWLTVAGAGPSVVRIVRDWRDAMKWKTPVIVEIAVGLEINAYACAEI